MKPIRFLGDSLKQLRGFPESARQDAGYQLDKVQVWDETGTYRVIYTARLKAMVVVLHAFQKKTQATAKADIELARPVGCN